MFPLYLSYKVIIESDNFQKFLENTTKIPAYCLIYSPYCGHCTKVHPTWIQLMDEFEKDESVIIAEIDAIKNGKYVDHLMKITGYPTFLTIVHMHATEKRVPRDIEHFREVVNQLKSINMSINCRLFNVNESLYPCLTVTGPSLEEACQTMHDIGAHYIIPDNSSTELGLSLHIAKNVVLNYTGSLSNSLKVREFLNERDLEPLGSWKLPKTSIRTVGVLVYNRSQDKRYFLDSVKQISDRYAIAGMLYSDYIKHYSYEIKGEDIPAIVFVNSTKGKTEYRLLKKVRPSHIENIDEQTMMIDVIKNEKKQYGLVSAIIITGYIFVLGIIGIAYYLMKHRAVPKME